MITIDKFNYRYADKGGYAQFYKMIVEELKKNKEVSVHFGFSRNCVGKYKIDLFPLFDARFERRNRGVNAILEYMSNHSEYESQQAFKFRNRSYFKEALFLAYKMGIYK